MAVKTERERQRQRESTEINLCISTMLTVPNLVALHQMVQVQTTGPKLDLRAGPGLPMKLVMGTFFNLFLSHMLSI